MLQLSDQLSYRYRQYLLSPMGRTRLAWDFLAVLFICTEMITMPLRTWVVLWDMFWFPFFPKGTYTKHNFQRA